MTVIQGQNHPRKIWDSSREHLLPKDSQCFSQNWWNCTAVQTTATPSSFLFSFTEIKAYLIATKDGLCNAGTSAQCYILAWMGRGFVGEWIHVLGCCQSNWKFCIVHLCYLVLEYILKCGYVIHHFNAHFSLFLLMIYYSVFNIYFRLWKWC